MNEDEYHKYYEARIMELIKSPKRVREWLIYYQKTPYLIDISTSLKNLERMVKDIK